MGNHDNYRPKCFAHDRLAELSQHVQICDLIGSSEYLQQSEFKKNVKFK